MQLQDKIILLTGGSGLLGKEIFNLLKSRGAIVINLDIKLVVYSSKFNEKVLIFSK